MFIFSLTGLHF